MTTLYPIVQSAKIIILYLYLLLRQALLCQQAVWQGMLSMLDMPCSPQALVLLWSAKSQGQIACNRPAISLSSSVSTLDPTAGSKEDYHSPIKKVNLPSLPPPTASYVFISTHLCFCVAFPLTVSFFLLLVAFCKHYFKKEKVRANTH